MKPIKLIFAIVLLSSFSLQSQTFSFFQPQQKRDSLLPIFNVGDVFSYQIKSSKDIFEEDDKIKSSNEDFSLGLEVKKQNEKTVNLVFLITKKQLCQRTFGQFFSVQNIDNQPIEIILNVERNAKLVNIENYSFIVKMLLEEINQLANADPRYKETLFYNQIEKLKFDIKNADAKLASSTFLDIVYYFNAYTFPVKKHQIIPYIRSDYEYFGAGKSCVFENKRLGGIEYFNDKLDATKNANQEVNAFNYRYSVYFDNKNLPQSVGLFLMKKTDKQKVVETWTLLKQ